MTPMQIVGVIIFPIGLLIWIYLLKAFFLGVQRIVKEEILRNSDGSPILDDDRNLQFHTTFEYHAYEFKPGDGNIGVGVAFIFALFLWCASWIPLFYR